MSPYLQLFKVVLVSDSRSSTDNNATQHNADRGARVRPIRRESKPMHFLYTPHKYKVENERIA